MIGLKRNLGLVEIIFYGVGVILGAGIYALIGQGAGLAGNSLWMAFVIGALVASFTGLSYAELSSLFPKAAAEYVYVKKAFGLKVLAFLIGWLVVVTGVTAVATVSLGFAGYFKALFGTPIVITAIALIIAMSYINFIGIKESSRLNIIFTLIEASGLVIIIFLAIFHFENIVKVDYLEMANGMKGVLSAAALMFFAYLGFEHIANVAEETRRPEKILAKAFIFSIVITTVLYVLTSIAVVSIADYAELGNSESPLAFAVSKTILGSHAPTVMSAIALFATSNTVLVMMIATTRVLYGVGRDGSLPKFLSVIHKSRRTPHFAILTVMTASIILLFFGKIDFVANLTSLGSFIVFTLVNGSLIWMRFRYPKLKRPFKSPVNIGNFPVLAFLGLTTAVFMMFQFKPEIVLYTTILIFSGLIIYQIVQKKFIG